MAEITSYTVSMSYRITGKPLKKNIVSPSWDDVIIHLKKVEDGDVEFLSLIGPEKDFTHMAILAKPGNYQIGIFMDEDEEYLFQSSEISNKKVDICGNYWPKHLICTKWDELVDVVKEFFERGKPSELFNWIHFSEKD